MLFSFRAGAKKRKRGEDDGDLDEAEDTDNGGKRRRVKLGSDDESDNELVYGYGRMVCKYLQSWFCLERVTGVAEVGQRPEGHSQDYRQQEAGKSAAENGRQNGCFRIRKRSTQKRPSENVANDSRKCRKR